MDLDALTPTITVEDAGELLGLSRSAAYRAADKAQLLTIRFGRRLFVPTPKLLKLLGGGSDETRADVPSGVRRPMPSTSPTRWPVADDNDRFSRQIHESRCHVWRSRMDLYW